MELSFPLEDHLAAVEKRLLVEDFYTGDLDTLQLTFARLLDRLRSRSFVKKHREAGLALLTEKAFPTDPSGLEQELLHLTAVALASGWTGPDVEDAVDELRVEVGIRAMLTESKFKDCLRGLIRAGQADRLSLDAIFDAMDDLQGELLNAGESA